MFWSGRGGRKQENERIHALEERQETLESGLRLLKTEWISTYDKLNSVMGRLNARIRKNKALEEVEAETEEEMAPAPTVQVSGTHGLLAARRARRGF